LQAQDRSENFRDDANALWPVHRGGLILRLYSHSLSIALVVLFLLSFGLHPAGSTRRMIEESLQHGQPPQAMADTLVDPEFWYESFQNWQSEFLSIGVLLVLGIYLRERGRRSRSPWQLLMLQPGTDKAGHPVSSGLIRAGRMRGAAVNGFQGFSIVHSPWPL
jgi:hypothetical protein